MAGNTATIDRITLRAQWDSYIPMAAICQHWTITKDQLVRLRTAWSLPLRLDRKRRHKPSRLERMQEPDDVEMAASEASLDLAPMIARRTTTIQAAWTADVRAERQVVKPQPFRMARIEVPQPLQDEAESISQDGYQ